MGIHFILASQSPRRRELIQLLGYPFTAIAADADEESIQDPNPVANVLKTARLKSTLVANQFQNDSFPANTWILAADTTVAFAGEMLNKPANEPEARHMLQRLRNSAHKVHTGVVIFDPDNDREWHGVSTAVVTMRPYSDAEIDAYIATGDPMDKAGAYAIQHPIFKPVARLEGCYCNVMGLPVCDIIIGLSQFARLDMKEEAPYDLTAVTKAHLDYPCSTLKMLQAR